MKTKIGKLLAIAMIASASMTGQASAFGLNYLRQYYDFAAHGSNLNNNYKIFGDAAKTEFDGKTGTYGVIGSAAAPAPTTVGPSITTPALTGGVGWLEIAVPTASCPAGLVGSPFTVTGAGTWEAPNDGTAWYISGGTTLAGARIVAKHTSVVAGTALVGLRLGCPVAAVAAGTTILLVDTGVNPPGSAAALPTGAADVLGTVSYSVTNAAQPAEVTSGAAAANTTKIPLSAKPTVGQYAIPTGGTASAVSGEGIPPSTFLAPTATTWVTAVAPAPPGFLTGYASALYNDNSVSITPPGGTRPGTGTLYQVNVPSGKKVTCGAQSINTGMFYQTQQYARGLGSYYTQYGNAWNSYWIWLGYQNFAVLATNLANGAAALNYGRALADQFADAMLTENGKYVQHVMAAGGSRGWPVNTVTLPAAGAVVYTTTSVTIQNPDVVAATAGYPTADTATATNRAYNRFAVGDIITGVPGMLPGTTYTVTAASPTTGVVTWTPAIAVAPAGTFTVTCSNPRTVTNPYGAGTVAANGPAWYYLYKDQPNGGGTNYLTKLVEASTANSQYGAWINLGAQQYGLFTWYTLYGRYVAKFYTEEATRLFAVAGVGLTGSAIADPTAANAATTASTYNAALYASTAAYWWDLTINQ